MVRAVRCPQRLPFREPAARHEEMVRAVRCPQRLPFREPAARHEEMGASPRHRYPDNYGQWNSGSSRPRVSSVLVRCSIPSTGATAATVVGEPSRIGWRSWRLQGRNEPGLPL